MRSRNITNLFYGLALLAATAAAASAQTPGAPVVSHPSSASVSPNLSDLPTAHWAQGQNLKMVPTPKPLPPRGAGPGGTSPPDGALQHEEGPHLPVNSKTKFGGIGASGFIPPDPNIAVGKMTPPVTATSCRWSTARSPSSIRAAPYSADQRHSARCGHRSAEPAPAATPGIPSFSTMPPPTVGS